MRRSRGCLRLACGTTGGRNCLANLARIAALTVVRLNLLEFSISLDRLRRSARRFHAPVDLWWPGLVDSSISFLTARFVKCRRMPKNERRSLRIFNGLEIAGSSPTASWRETGSGCNTTELASESAPVAPRGIIEPGSLKAEVITSRRNIHVVSGPHQRIPPPLA